jgi:hypothetical protein
MTVGGRETGNSKLETRNWKNKEKAAQEKLQLEREQVRATDKGSD